MYWLSGSTRSRVAALCVVTVLWLCALATPTSAQTGIGASPPNITPSHNVGANRALRLPSHSDRPSPTESPFDRLPAEPAPDFPRYDDSQLATSPTTSAATNSAAPKSGEPVARSNADLLPRVLGIATCVTVIVMSVGGFVHWGLWFVMRVPKQEKQRPNPDATPSSRGQTNVSRRNAPETGEEQHTADLLRQIAIRFDQAHQTPAKPPVYQSRVPLNIPTRSEVLSRPVVQPRPKPIEETATPVAAQLSAPPVVPQIEQQQTTIEEQLQITPEPQPTLPMPPAADKPNDKSTEDQSEAGKTELDMEASFAESLFRDNMALRSQLSSNQRQAAAQSYTARSA